MQRYTIAILGSCLFFSFTDLKLHWSYLAILSERTKLQGRFSDGRPPVSFELLSLVASEAAFTASMEVGGGRSRLRHFRLHTTLLSKEDHRKNDTVFQLEVLTSSA